MQITRPVSRPPSPPRFGMTPEQQKEVREKVFDTFYPHLDDALEYVRKDYTREGIGRSHTNPLSDRDQAANTLVNTMAQLATYQEAPKRPPL